MVDFMVDGVRFSIIGGFGDKAKNCSEVVPNHEKFLQYDVI